MIACSAEPNGRYRAFSGINHGKGSGKQHATKKYNLKYYDIIIYSSTDQHINPKTPAYPVDGNTAVLSRDAVNAFDAVF